MTTPTPRTTVKRLADRARYDPVTLYSILDEAPCCHVGFVDGATPFVLPTIHARLGDRLYLHGSRGSRLLSIAASGAEICVAATILDGLVLARSAFHHSMNYRSAVVVGTGRAVDDVDEKLRALEAVTEHVMKGRWADVRKPSSREFNRTAVVAVPIAEASAKVRTGPPSDDDDDYSLDVWAGVVPVSLQPGAPVPDPRLRAGIAVPSYLPGAP